VFLAFFCGISSLLLISLFFFVFCEFSPGRHNPFGPGRPLPTRLVRRFLPFFLFRQFPHHVPPAPPCTTLVSLFFAPPCFWLRSVAHRCDVFSFGVGPLSPSPLFSHVFFPSLVWSNHPLHPFLIHSTSWSLPPPGSEHSSRVVASFNPKLLECRSFFSLPSGQLSFVRGKQ